MGFFTASSEGCGTRPRTPEPLPLKATVAKQPEEKARISLLTLSTSGCVALVAANLLKIRFSNLDRKFKAHALEPCGTRRRAAQAVFCRGSGL